MRGRAKKHGLPQSLQDQIDDAEHHAELYEYKSPKEFADEILGPSKPFGITVVTPDDSPKTEIAQYPPGTEESQQAQTLPTLEWLKDQFKTKSAAIRYLCNRGFPNRIIAKHLNIRHQHVRNVVTSPLKRGPNEDWRPKPKEVKTI